MAEGVRTPIPRLRAHDGWAILAYGFRPFFFLAGLSAVLVLAVWLAAMAGVLVVATAFAPPTWHAHEVLFGFAVAAIAGFLLTAVPNWTCRLPLQGGLLLWLVSRLPAGLLPAALSAVLGT